MHGKHSRKRARAIVDMQNSISIKILISLKELVTLMDIIQERMHQVPYLFIVHRV
jgi:hypothetical protein